MKKELTGTHEQCINRATKLMCVQIMKCLFISGLHTEIRQQVESNLSACKDNQELLKAALTAEESLSKPETSQDVLEISEIPSLRQELDFSTISCRCKNDEFELISAKSSRPSSISSKKGRSGLSTWKYQFSYNH